ncbi:MAG: DUF202 domain-containing protein [Thermodesulfovibrionales bacterium]
MAQEPKPHAVRNRRVHLANERTFLAWIRTSISIMAFGFVIEKFALFVRQLALYMGQQGLADAVPPSGKSASFFGVGLVVLGTAMGLLAFIRYKKTEREIDEDAFRPSRILDLLLALSMLAIGVFLAVYLFHSM